MDIYDWLKKQNRYRRWVMPGRMFEFVVWMHDTKRVVVTPDNRKSTRITQQFSREEILDLYAEYLLTQEQEE